PATPRSHVRRIPRVAARARRESCARESFLDRAAESNDVAVGVGDMHLAQSPWHVGRRQLDDRALANQLVVQAVDGRREDHHPRAGTALAALAHEQHGVAAADRTEVRWITVLPVDLEAERIAIVALARMEAADVQDRPRTRQVALAAARLRGFDERIVALAGALAPRQPEHETANRQDREPHGTNVAQAA